MKALPKLLLALGLAAGVSPAPAQDYPARPVKAIVAVGPGGTGDVVTRVFGEELHRRWGQPLVVENRAGGASNIGARAGAEAPPDGYTICVRSGVPQAAAHRPRARADLEYAGGICPLHHRGPRQLRACGSAVPPKSRPPPPPSCKSRMA